MSATNAISVQRFMGAPFHSAYHSRARESPRRARLQVGFYHSRLSLLHRRAAPRDDERGEWPAHAVVWTLGDCVCEASIIDPERDGLTRDLGVEIVGVAAHESPAVAGPEAPIEPAHVVAVWAEDEFHGFPFARARIASPTSRLYFHSQQSPASTTGLSLPPCLAASATLAASSIAASR